jgi:hypothetical protein
MIVKGYYHLELLQKLLMLLNDLILKDKEAQAKKSGNTNAESIAKGKRTEAEALLHDYENILNTFNKED